MARPNIWRLIILMWLTRPSTGPEFQRLVRPWTTASQSFSAGGERVEAGKFLGSRADDPVLQMLAGAGGEDRGKAADETVGRREFRATGEDFGQLFALAFRDAVGVTHDPPGDLPESWWRGPDDADTASAPRPQIVTDDLIVAPVAQLFELCVQVNGIGVALCPAPVQLGLVRVQLAGPGLPPTAEQLLRGRRTGASADVVPTHV